MTYTFGIEIEISGASISAIKSALSNAEIRGCDVKPDGTPGVDAEIVLPPLAPCDFAWDYIKSICRVLDRVGASVNSKCGLHVHIGNAPLNDDTHAVRFCGDSILERHRTGRYITGAYADPMDFVAVQDIMFRYTRQQSTINTMFPRSRTDNRYCAPLSVARIERATTISELTFGKFTTVNLETWSRGTIEFRQASGTVEADKIINWVKFLLNLVDHTNTARVEGWHPNNCYRYARTAIPPRRACWCSIFHDAFRRRRNHARNHGRNRMLVSNAFAPPLVKSATALVMRPLSPTHNKRTARAMVTAQATLAYTVLFSFETTTDGATLLPEHRIGNPSIWAGLSDELFEWWHNRVLTLTR